MQEKNNFIKKISYNPFIIKFVRFLGLRTLLRKAYYWFAKPENNLLTATINGISLKLKVRNPDELRLAEAVSGQGGEGPVLETFLPHLKSGDTVFDVGANIGVWTVFMAKAVGERGKVVAFEPEEKSFLHLKDNLAVNNIESVVLVKKALGEKNAVEKLYIGKTTGNFSLLKPYEESVDFEEVEVVNGDDFTAQNNFPVPVAVKIDVEGYEYAVLKGLQKTLSDPSCKVLCCEVHPGLFPQGITENHILDFIDELGFKNKHIFKRAFSAYHVIAAKN